jgi:hypothetical protein
MLPYLTIPHDILRQGFRRHRASGRAAISLLRPPRRRLPRLLILKEATAGFREFSPPGPPMTDDRYQTAIEQGIHRPRELRARRRYQLISVVSDLPKHRLLSFG